ncbi:formylglycine-generating enzyme family protein [Stieleria sp. TO1_6]|uniref:formylglycine-generating enzyme family protein n=1 Tax=Stieleria tagensis TaxID=2956795 RepID=UPI00209B8D09|nr:SUMF1/EgtB/PvdO family nonheme iron enzyme [Stieleria tagensis]MCO8124657.1 formylglycine-generating enzyme family protein [Stieleria tagensis]
MNQPVDPSLTLDFPDAPPDIRKMVRDRQYAKIVRPQDGVLFDSESLQFAWKAIDHDMAYVPGGSVTLCGEYATTSDEGFILVPQTIGSCDAESVYLDRWCVTNADFKGFVDAGGYSDAQLWPEHVLPSVLQFVDMTGRPGPAHWFRGAPDKNCLAHPVVGVSWYEANAYAQWVGKRLPSSAEWQRAGTWGKTSSDTLEESKYPWGNSFDPEYANTWACGKHHTVSVHECTGGNTPNGVRQLIGNVWEWMNTQYILAATEEITVHLTDPMAEIRGGAFDSYFHSHISCHGRSAQTLSSRKSNIGFRCCFSAEGLVPPGDGQIQSEPVNVFA